MDIFNVLSLIGGLALFLFGMNVMGAALEKRASGQLKSVLGKLTSNKWKGFVLGAGVTAVIQSSSATTVMVVGFVNSGIMTLRQAINIIMGANVGTTITSWILSLTGLEGSNIWIRLLKPASFTPILAFIGIILFMFTKNTKKKDVGTILLGFAVLMFGMEMMSDAVSPLRDVPAFQNILTMFSNPVLGVLAGAFLTAVIQSSSASVGILQALASTGRVTYGSAIPIIMGQNIGTCITAIISSVGATKNAKRTAAVHLMFNIIGTAVWLSVFCVINRLINFAFIDAPVNELGIAVVHTVFNILCTLLIFPFARQLEKLACIFVKDSDEEEKFQMLDERFIATPAVAIERCKDITTNMAHISINALNKSCKLINKFDEKIFEEVVFMEQEVDKYEDKLGTYLVKLSSHDMSDEDSKAVSELLHIIGDFERISDHAVSIGKSAEEINNKKLRFSESAREELSTMINATNEIMEIAITAFKDNNYDSAIKVEALEHVIDKLKYTLKKQHIARLKSGECTIELGFVMTDIVTHLERVSDHCSNIASCVEEISHSSLGMHQYAQEIDKTPGSIFNIEYNKYCEKYVISGAK
ncbi:MAG: Na/Pi cotransporter family protein [Eubacterium sp.]